MRRGKGQVLFKYLPGKPMDADKNGLGIVVSWSSTPADGLNKERILREIYDRFDRYRNPHPSGYPPKLDTKRFRLLSPKGIEYDLFPLTFTCSNPACGKAFTFNGSAQFNSITRQGKCPRCRTGKMIQLDLVHVEAGGRIGFPRLSPCENHGYEYMTLEKFGSDNPGEWKFICGVCRKPGKGGGSMNSSTKFLGAPYKEMIYPVPLRKGQVYIPQSLLLVNLQKLDEKRLYGDRTFQKKILADFLGLFKKRNIEFDDLIEVKDEVASQKLSMIENLKGKVPAEYLEKVRKEMESSFPDKANIESEIVEETESMVDFGKIDLKEAAASIYEYMEMLKKSGATGLQRMIEIAKKQNHPNLENIKEFPKRMKAIKVSKAYVLNDLSLVQAVYGYTRGSFASNETDLCSFPPDKNYEREIPIYVNEVNSEAIVLEFDRIEIIKWLAENRVIPKSEIPANDEEAKVWFLENVSIDAISRFRELTDDSLITKWVYTLLHSASHMLLLNSTVLCGMDKDSLSELIYPNIPAIVIYANNIRGTQLGGMYTLFENRIYPWIDQTLKSITTCIYDPLCSDHQGACHACMFLSEFSCCHFNNDVSRWYLAGYKDKIKGFWQNAKL